MASRKQHLTDEERALRDALMRSVFIEGGVADQALGLLRKLGEAREAHAMTRRREDRVMAELRRLRAEVEELRTRPSPVRAVPGRRCEHCEAARG